MKEKDEKRSGAGRSTIGLDAATEQYIKELQERRKLLGIRHNAKSDVINDAMMEHKKHIGLPPLPGDAPRQRVLFAPHPGEKPEDSK